jgi:protein TonB
MLTVLLESRATPSRHLGGTILSALVHGGAIAAVIALTIPNRDNLTKAPEIRPTPVHYVRTPPQPIDAPRRASQVTDGAGAAPRENLPVIDFPDFTPRRIPPIDLARPSTPSDQVLIGNRSHALSAGSDIGIPIGGVDGVSDASAVDRVPRIVGRALEPRYPATLRSAGIEGRVLAEFVVDTLGRADLATLHFPELANPLFGDAVREALARYRFLPGEVAGRKVRTRVAVPFDFRLEKQVGRRGEQ